jgi:hypothetical protein
MLCGILFLIPKYQVRMSCHAWAVKNGVHTSHGSTPARRKIMKRMQSHLFGLNTSKGFKDRYIITLNRQAVHRGGEHANMTWNFVHWNEEEHNICGDKRESKTGRDTTIPFVASADFLECHSHAMACWLITNEQSFCVSEKNKDTLNLAPDFLFPEHYSDKPGEPAKSVSKIVKDCYNANVEGMTSDMSSTSLRCGAVDDMMMNTHLDFIDAICR